MGTLMNRVVSLTACGVAALASTVVPATTEAAAPEAAAPAARVYVSPTGSPGARDTSCQTARYSVIDAAIAAVAVRGKVVVCPGTYEQTVTVDKTLTLKGHPGAIIEQAGLVGGRGIYVGADWVKIRGITVKDGFGGIGVNADHVTITGNTLSHMAAHPSAGILVSGSYARVIDNTVTGVTGFGIAVQDLYGYDPLYEPGRPPAAHNEILGNRVKGTVGWPGIVLQSFPGNGGVFANLLRDNVVKHTRAAADAPCGEGGPGVLLGSGSWWEMSCSKGQRPPVTLPPGPPAGGGGVHNNTVQGNRIHGNGWPGVMVVNQDERNMDGNVISANRIGADNLLGISKTDFMSIEDPETTGIMVASPSPLSISLVGNVISSNYHGIWKTSLVRAPAAGPANRFVDVTVPVFTFNKP